MVSKTTNSVKVTVVTEYDTKNSFPSDNRFVFRYHITIENLGVDSIKLLKRKWLIYDLGYGFTEVIGDGVIGLTPEIFPKSHFNYFSNVILRSGVGYMEGLYTFQNLETHEDIEVEVPKFELLTEVLSN